MIRVPVPARMLHCLGSIALVCTLCGILGAGDPGIPVYVPDVEHEAAPAIEGTTWVDAGPMHSLRLTRLGNEARQAYIEKAVGSETDPFATRPDEPEGYLTYLLQVANPGDAALIFNPGHCWLSTGKEIRTPVGPADISFSYKVADSGFPPAYEKVGGLLLHRTRMIQPGQSLHGLLVYRAPKHKTRHFTLDVQLALGTGDIVKFSAPYRRLSKKELQDQAR